MALYWCSLVLLAWIGARDWRQRRITNTSLLFLSIPGLVYAGFFGGPAWPQVGLNLFIGLALTLPGYIRGVVGGGDVKLMVAVAPLWPPLTLLVIFAAGTIAVALMLQFCRYMQQHPGSAIEGNAPPLGAPCSHNPACLEAPGGACGKDTFGLPLGSAIALGALLMHVGTTVYSTFFGLT